MRPAQRDSARKMMLPDPRFLPLLRASGAARVLVGFPQ